MKSINVELYLGIVFIQGVQEETITVTEKDCDLDDDEELEAYLSDYWKEWSSDLIFGGWAIIEETK